MQFKKETGLEYKPGMTPPPTSAPAPQVNSSSCPYTRVTQQGDLVRKLKAGQAPKVRGRFVLMTSSLNVCLPTVCISACWSSHNSFYGCSLSFSRLCSCPLNSVTKMSVYLLTARVLVICQSWSSPPPPSPPSVFMHAELFSCMHDSLLKQ